MSYTAQVPEPWKPYQTERDRTVNMNVRTPGGLTVMAERVFSAVGCVNSKECLGVPVGRLKFDSADGRQDCVTLQFRELRGPLAWNPTVNDGNASVEVKLCRDVDFLELLGVT